LSSFVQALTWRRHSLKPTTDYVGQGSALASRWVERGPNNEWSIWRQRHLPTDRVTNNLPTEATAGWMDMSIILAGTRTCQHSLQ